MKYISFTLAVIATLTAGCAISPADNKIINGKVELSKTEVERLIKARVEPIAASPVSYSSESWIPLRKIEKSNRDLANAKTNLVDIEINQNFKSLNDVAETISSLTGLTVFVGSDISSSTAGRTSSENMPMNALPRAAGTSMLGLPGGPLPKGFSTPMGASSIGQLNASQGTGYAANYSGSLTGFMNIVSAYYGVYWKTEASSLYFFLMDSKTYRIAALPGDTRLSSSVESASNAAGVSGSSANGGGATQSGTSSNSTGVGYSGLSVWTSLESSIKLMLGATGKVIASPATGTITVTDTPNVLSRVTDFINDQNKSLNRQVSVNVRVLSVELNEGEDYGINWDSVYANLSSAGNPFSVALKTAFPVATGAGNLIISAPVASSSRWAGSSAMISALSTQGRVSELTSATLVTLNNQAAPVNVGRKVSYLASSSSTAGGVAGAAPTVTLTPGTVQTGFSMTLVPHIIDNKEMLLQYSLDRSTLLALQTITSGTSSIQTPDISTSNFIQRVRIQSGETLVVAGFDQDNLSAVADGIGSPQNTALGRKTGSTKRTMLVILIQPNLSL